MYIFINEVLEKVKIVLICYLVSCFNIRFILCVHLSNNLKSINYKYWLNYFNNYKKDIDIRTHSTVYALMTMFIKKKIHINALCYCPL